MILIDLVNDMPYYILKILEITVETATPSLASYYIYTICHIIYIYTICRQDGAAAASYN